MGIDVGLSEVDRIEIVFEEVNNEDITVELVDNPVTIELETPPEIQVAVNEIYSDVNVILDHDNLINRNLNKQHTAETIQESTSKRFTSDTEIGSKANQIDLTNHINDLNNPHETGINNLEGFPITPTLTKFLRDDKTFAEIALKHSQLISPNEDVNVQHLTDSEKAELHTHSNKSVLDTITSVLVSGWNAAATWVSTYGANVLTHIADNSIHVTSTLLSTINNKVDKVEGKGLSTNDFITDYKDNGAVGTGVANPSPVSGKDLSTINKLTNAVDNVISDKLSKQLGVNLLDVNAQGVDNGKYLNNIGGILINNAYYISDYIPVVPNKIYTHSNLQLGGAYACIYDDNKIFISSFQSTTITIPSNGHYIRLSAIIAKKNIQQFESGSVTTSYKEYTEYLPLQKVEDKVNGVLSDVDIKLVGKLDRIIGKNLLNPYDADIMVGKFLQGGGYIGTNAMYSISGYINITSIAAVTINFNKNGGFCAFYDANKAYISSIGTGRTFTVPIGAVYFRVSGGSTTQISWQVESGTTSTDFEPYTEYYPLGQVQRQVYDVLVDVVLPSKMYFVKNKQSCIYFENVLRKNLNDNISLYISKGTNYNRLCALKFTESALNQTMSATPIQALKKHSVKAIAYDVVNPTDNNGKTVNVLHVGDSFTDIGTWVKETKLLLNSQGVTYNMIGTCGDSTFRAEGLSGGTLLNTFMDTSMGVGRMVQVMGVTTLPSTTYPGRVYRDANGKDWTIRSGKIDGSGNGYVVVTKYRATETDFINFPISGTLTKQSTGEGDAVINYTNPMSCYYNPFINPITGQLDMNNYLATWGLPTPNVVIIQFTWNDIAAWATDRSISEVVANFKIAVDHIHASLPNSKVVLSIEPFGSVNGNLDFNGKKYSVLKFAELMITQFESNVNYSSWVKIAPSYAFVDLTYGYSSSTVKPCERYELTEQSGGDGTHPSEIGMKQIADCVSQVVSCII